MRKVILLSVFVCGLISWFAAGRARAVSGPDLKLTAFAIESGVFNVIFAKELCSCHFVDGLDIEDCKARDNLPSAAHYLVNLEVDEENHTVSSSYISPIQLTEFVGLTPGPAASARLVSERPQDGCVLTAGPGL